MLILRSPTQNLFRIRGRLLSPTLNSPYNLRTKPVMESTADCSHRRVVFPHPYMVYTHTECFYPFVVLTLNAIFRCNKLSPPSARYGSSWIFPLFHSERWSNYDRRTTTQNLFGIHGRLLRPVYNPVSQSSYPSRKTKCGIHGRLLSNLQLDTNHPDFPLSS